MPELPEKPKKELLLPTNSFKYLLSSLPKKEVGEIIRQIEEALASGPMWCNERHYFLENSEKHALDAALNRLEAGKFKISPEKMKKIARLGLVCAYQKKIVTAKQIGEFIDDIASLWLFASILGEVEFEGNMSPVWERAFVLPPDVSGRISRGGVGDEKLEDLLYRIFRQAKEEGSKEN